MFLYVWFFILGTIVGSFVCLCIDRLPLGISIAEGRSFCFECFHPLDWKDLIPIVSFVLLKGRCRYCQKRISIFYPFFEIFSGCLLVFLVYYETQILKALLLFLLIMDFIVISIIDHKWMIIPDICLIWEIVMIICLCSFYQIPLIERLIGLFIISGPILLLNCFLPDSFGGGDIKLLCINGFLLGYRKIVVAFVLAVLFGGGYASYLMVQKGVNRKEHMAFGIYLCIGILIALFWGEQILSLYGL